jgi:oxazoline/thiazoline synthase
LSDWRPKFRGDVQPRVLGRNLVVLDTWSGVELLEGRLSSALAHSLKGEIPISEIIAQLAGNSETLRVIWELEELRQRGLVTGAEPAAESAPPVVVATDYLDPHLEEINRQALEARRPWTLVRPHGMIVWIGPVFVPGHGPCWACMAARLRAVRAAWQLPERRGDDDAPVMPVALELAALEAARWTPQPDARTRLLTFDTRSLSWQAHVITQRRDCPACGDPSARGSFAPVILQSRSKAFTLDGGHRAVPPEETYARYEHLASPLTGIVHHVERASADSGTLNVFVARHNFTIGDQTRPGRSFGKGLTAAQARTGALCEALERYCGVFRGDEPLLRAAFRDLGEEAVHPNACLGISERQFREREEWNRAAPSLLQIPEPFDEEQETDWAPAWSLTHESKRFVAAALCYYNYPGGANRFGRDDSNGNAAGTCIEDAVLQGLFELVERDAVGIWWYGRIRRPAAAADTPFVAAMTREHAARGRALRLFDLTTDLGIPVCAAVSVGAEPESLLVGFGAHLDPALAITRAVTEANQLLAVKRKGRLHGGSLADWAFLEPQGMHELTTTTPPSDDLRGDVLACVDILRRHGLETIVLDQTRDEIGLSVVKVIVPGLRHFRPRFAPGRLYEVPWRLGWVERPLREEELNSSHITA